MDYNFLWALFYEADKLKWNKKMTKPINPKQIQKKIYHKYLKSDGFDKSFLNTISIELQFYGRISLHWGITGIPLYKLMYPLAEHKMLFYLQQNCFPDLSIDTISNVIFNIQRITDSFRLDIEKVKDGKGENWYFAPMKNGALLKSKPYLLKAIKNFGENGRYTELFWYFLMAASRSQTGGMESIADFDIGVSIKNDKKFLSVVIPNSQYKYTDFLSLIAKERDIVEKIQKYFQKSHYGEERIFLKKKKIGIGLEFLSYIFNNLTAVDKRIKEPYSDKNFHMYCRYETGIREFLNEEAAIEGSFEECIFENIDFSNLKIYADFINCQFIRCNFKQSDWGIGFDQREYPIVGCTFDECYNLPVEHGNNFSQICQRVSIKNYQYKE